MKTAVSTLGTFCGARRGMLAALALGFLGVLLAAPTGQAQTNSLNFENNYFVTGDYVVGGWANKKVDPNRAGYATGTISVPDSVQTKAVKVPQAGVPTAVPDGADIVAAYLYWTTVEKSQSQFAGQSAFFQHVAITGAVLGNPNAPVSWSSGGCSGASNGTTTMRVYRANVRPLLPVDGNGIVRPNTSYTVELADSGSNGNTTPFTLGATLVIIYRVLDPSVPLNAIVLYDGAAAPSNAGSTMSQLLQGFYEPATTTAPFAKITHIVANGQTKKSETVSLNNTPLPPLYGNNLPPFPGIYNGDWDNPTWVVSNLLNPPPNDPSDTTSVVPSSKNSGCVSWGVIVFSTTVQDSDGDGLLDYWEDPPGPNNPVNNSGVTGTMNPQGDPGYVDVGTGNFVALPGANPNQKDIFLQLDYMCSGSVSYDSTLGKSTCDTSNGGVSLLPSQTAMGDVVNAFASNGHDINLHIDVKNAIPEDTCTDSTDSSGNPVLCSYPSFDNGPQQPGVVGWKGGYTFLKNQPLNDNADGTTWTETQCENNPATCVRRFQHGRKDSYHYMIAANAAGVLNWTFGGSLTSVGVDSSGVATFHTTTPPGLSPTNPTGVVANDSVDGNGRVTVTDVFTAPYLNGVYYVTGVSPTAPYSFTIQTTNVPAGTYNMQTDPNLSVASGKAGTVSGISDIGGADSMIALGGWGADGQTWQVQAGTMMHELGHSLGLTHGGFYYDNGNYVPTIEANCKSNFQSVMNYMFQFDLLLDGSGNQVPDYSEQDLTQLNEQALFGVTALTAAGGVPTTYQDTKWYVSDPPDGIGTPAKWHCDGTPILPTDPDPTMYRVTGLTNPISPAWNDNQDINFNGSIDSSLRGHDDWGNLFLRQVGASGSLSTAGAGGFSLNQGGFSLNQGGFSLNQGGFSLNQGGFSLNQGGFSLNQGGGLGEITHAVANSVTRPPRNLRATMLSSPAAVRLDWDPPTFGQIGAYNVYRGVDGATPAIPAYGTVTGTPPVTTFTDTSISCGHTYTYFVSAVLAGTSQESVHSNSVTVTKCTVGP